MHLRDLAPSLSQGAVVAFNSTSFCYVDGLIRPADSFVTDPVNLGNPIEMSVSDFADVVANLVGDTGRIYKDLPVSDPVRRRPDISLARAELGWEPMVPLVDGLQRTTEYLRDVRS
jgi:nucleoside-diphosphate-sugar epimerase